MPFRHFAMTRLLAKKLTELNITVLHTRKMLYNLPHSRSMDLLKNLNPAQREAVEINDKNILIVAGAGSGKTRVLTHKIAYLIKEKEIKPHEILAMTFSNRAAKEMKDRIASLLGPDQAPYWVGTFHSICVRLLREFIQETHLKENFTIYDEDDQNSVIRESLSLLNLDDKKYKTRGLVEIFSRSKNKTLDENRYFERENDRINLENIFLRYQGLLSQSNALDFGGILIEALKLIKKPEIKSILSERWKYILIDEYQDTNKIQRALLKNLKSKANSICAVGDDDQSIYMWRGATVENILSFGEDFEEIKVIKLEKNYRSTKRILTTANCLIQYNTQRMGKTLYTEGDEGDPVEYCQARDERDEANYISSKIDEITRRGARLSDIAVFYRTHAQSRAIEESLVAKSIPYKIIGGTKFYDRKEVKDILAYLKFFLNSSDSVAFRRIVNVPPRGIGKKTIQSLENKAQMSKISPWEVIRRKIPFGGKTHLKFGSFLKIIEAIDAFSDSSIYDLTVRILDLSGYKKMLEEDDSFESETRLDNIRELLGAIQEFEKSHSKSLKDYLEMVALVNEADDYEETEGYVSLMTAHCSKGLEFSVVFIAGLEDGLFPHQNSLEEFDELEEERRLFYVTITRAMKKLYLTNAFQRRVFATKTYKMPSRFLQEIKDSVIHTNPLPAPQTKRRAKRQDTESPYFHDYIPDYEEPHTPYRKGMKVSHPEFGDGVVKKCEKSGSHYRLTINFKYFGTKKIISDYVS